MIRPLLRWIDRHFRGFYTATGVYFMAGMVMALIALAILAQVMGAGLIQRWDEAALRAVNRTANPAFDVLALIGLALGSKMAGWIAAAVGTLAFWRSARRHSIYILWIAILGGQVLNKILKAAFARTRPTLIEGDLEYFGVVWPFPDNPSFPSGHAITAVVIFGTLAYLIIRLERSRRMRRATLISAVALILVIGASRVYMGVHYPSDVLAGYLVGFIWVTFAALGVEAIRYFRGHKARSNGIGNMDGHG